VYFSPTESARQIQILFDLSDQQAQIVEEELNKTNEDTILILHLNPNWRGHIYVGAVYDEIARFGMQENMRRDNGDGCFRWLFHFANFEDICACRKEIRRQFPEAFAHSPRALSAIAAAQAVAQAAIAMVLPVEPMAFAVVIHKHALHQSDFQEYPFFYF